ncbi:MAG: glycosyltransferase [Butyrivibrio sp.]|nr:glycosyltransferase [Butyrivibrio sp.]
MANLCYLNKKNPILSISIMTSNRKDTIRKSLDSITHLRQTVPSELVIVDTGCDAEMRSIIEEYTDKIVKFKWIKDFAAARNAGLRECTGKWFMYYDDDEWFEDTEQIEDFFLKGRYKLVDGCWYMQRNYMDHDGRTYTDDTVSRMMAMVPGLHFTGCIHEYLEPFDSKYTVVTSFVHHYGYIFDTDESKYIHTMRNLPLIKKMLKSDADNMRWWLQLAQEYRAIKEYHDVIDICTQGLEHFKHADDKASIRQLGSFYMSIIEAYYYLYDFEGSVAAGQNAITDKRLPGMALASIHAAMARAYARQKNFSAAKEEILIFEKHFNELMNDKARFIDEGYYMVDDAFDERHLSSLYWIMIREAVDRNDVAQMSEYMDKISWGKDVLYLFEKKYLDDLTDFAANSEFDLWFVNMMSYLMSCQNNRKQMIKHIKEYESAAVKALESGDKDSPDILKFNRLLAIFSYMDSKNYFINYMKLLSVGVKNAFPAEKEHIALYASNSVLADNEFLSYRKEYWEILAKYGFGMDKIIKGLSMDYFKECCDKFFENNDIEKINYMTDLFNISIISNEEKTMNPEITNDTQAIIDNSMLGVLPAEALSESFKEDIRYKYFIMRTTEEKFRRSKEVTDFESLRNIMLNFIDTQLDFYSKYYKPEVFETTLEILPPSCRAAVILNRAVFYEENNDYKTALSEYKQAIASYAPLAEALQTYVHLYADYLKATLLS